MSPAINYQRSGEGPPLLLLHGVGHHWQSWQPVIELLGDRYELIAADLPGFGRSAPLPSGVTPAIPAYADALEWFTAELGLERPHVAGNSMGGAIALELARRRAAASATAFSPAGFWTTAECRYCQLSLGLLGATPPALRPLLRRLACSRAGRVALFSQTYGYPARLPAQEAVATLDDAWASPALKGALAAFGGYRFAGDHGSQSVPTTVAWGRRDWLLPCALQAPRAQKILPHARHLTIGTGHVPQYDDPAQVAATIELTVGAVQRAVDGAHA